MHALSHQVWTAPEVALDARERELHMIFRRERWLLLAILQQALGDLFLLFNDVGVCSEDSLDAKEWFFSRSREPFSFRWLCKQLGVNPQKLCSILRLWLRNEPPEFMRLNPLQYLAPMPALVGCEDFKTRPEWLN